MLSFIGHFVLFSHGRSIIKTSSPSLIDRFVCIHISLSPFLFPLSPLLFFYSSNRDLFDRTEVVIHFIKL